MDTTNSGGQQPATDDQELAQVLAGMNQQAPAADPAGDGLQFEETGTTPAVPAVPTEEVMAPTVPAEPAEPEAPLAPPEPPVVPEPPAAVVAPVVEAAPASTLSPELESIKKDALTQLRPLVDKLDLPAQEKFDTLLLIIRSTDDQSLLTAANEAAKQIEDETKRAEALLDIIKEIDFFSHPA